jgi:hypothetical protein
MKTLLVAALFITVAATAASAQCPYPDIIPPAQVTTLHVDLVGTRTFTVEWLSTGDDGTVGNPTNYEVRTSDAPITESNWCSAAVYSVSPSAPNGMENCASFTILGNPCQRSFYVAVFCLDERDNRSPLSNVVAGTWQCAGNHIVECY